MLPPYFAGAAQSGLIPLLEGGHGGVKLHREELDKIAAWIDSWCPTVATTSKPTPGPKTSFAPTGIF